MFDARERVDTRDTQRRATTSLREKVGYLRLWRSVTTATEPQSATTPGRSN